MNTLRLLQFLSILVPPTIAVTIADIQGNAWKSPLVGQTVQSLTGLVTAKSSSGFYLLGDPVDDVRVSRGLTVFTRTASILNQVHVGDTVSLTGLVSEFRSSSDPDDLTATELQSPSNIVVISSNNTVTPLILGVERPPPTQGLSSLDIGQDGWLSVPSNQSRVDSVNLPLQPNIYGMDFWSSLESQLVTIRNPIAINFENSFGEFWVRGDWPNTGENGRGGLSLTFADDGVPTSNPEVIIVGSPLDGTKNPHVCVGKAFADITGVVVYQFGFYYILPTTAPTIVATPDPTVPATSLTSIQDDCVITIGDYNVENLTPTSSSLKTVATHIANFLLTPDLMFLQEIQDNSGATDDGIVSANVTLATLSTSVASLSNVTYNFVDLAPQNDQDGGQPGGNIRPAYLYRSTKLSIVTGSTPGGPLDATQPVIGSDGKVTFTFNPGRIDPTNVAWDSSRKPLVVAWDTPSGQRLFTINVHLVSKLGSSSTQGNSRPPVNAGIDQRTNQVETVANFVRSILALDPEANIILAGDFNEYVQTRSVFKSLDGLLVEVDENSGVDPVERYTYVFDQNSEQLDHIFVSSAIAKRGTKVEHVHVNNWSPTLSARTSDHDPSVAQLSIC
ncbi:hypothetical protein NLI96_g4901 [Meripilus lineatus]|uniref:Endonuclease/exonuclease/phosphatase domain-containing protein n=1 Tax=Meripilus lineatus TaxID=2056292 RepID=A0AAD5YJN5_9APHY|nr:hypothetical protein NLI96_g4901 [Physisporinus lineatus]